MVASLQRPAAHRFSQPRREHRIARRILLGGWVRASEALSSSLAAPHEGIGAARARALVTLDYSPRLDDDPDKDGIPLGLDACPMAAEDIDGIEDDDGCPEDATHVDVLIKDPYGGAIMNANAAIVQGPDRTPISATGRAVLEPGTYRITAEAPDYMRLDDIFTVEANQPMQIVKVMQPDEKPTARVIVKKDRIEILEKAYPDRSELRTASFSLLQEVAHDALPSRGPGHPGGGSHRQSRRGRLQHGAVPGPCRIGRPLPDRARCSRQQAKARATARPARSTSGGQPPGIGTGAPNSSTWSATQPTPALLSRPQGARPDSGRAPFCMMATWRIGGVTTGGRRPAVGGDGGATGSQADPPAGRAVDMRAWGSGPDGPAHQDPTNQDTQQTRTPADQTPSRPGHQNTRTQNTRTPGHQDTRTPGHPEHQAAGPRPPSPSGEPSQPQRTHDEARAGEITDPGLSTAPDASAAPADQRTEEVNSPTAHGTRSGAVAHPHLPWLPVVFQSSIPDRPHPRRDPSHRRRHPRLRRPHSPARCCHPCRRNPRRGSGHRRPGRHRRTHHSPGRFLYQSSSAPGWTSGSVSQSSPPYPSWAWPSRSAS